MNRFIIILIIFSFSACQNYDSEKYIKMENQAINDIILEMTEFKEMEKMNHWKNEKLKLYIISTLDTITSWTTKPDGYDIGANGIDYTKERIERNKQEFERNLAKFKKEERQFSDFKNGKIKSRNLNFTFKSNNLNIELTENREINILGIKENEFGYLSLSRILFNSNYTKGYLHFNFICGDGCAWDHNIEIKKINGKWEITEYFSGGIA